MTTEPKAITQADLDRALAEIEALKAKNEEVITDLRKAKDKARAAEGIDPADFARLETENEKLRADLAKATKETGTLSKRAEDAEKALAAETDNARNREIDLALADYATKIGVAPALAVGFKAWQRGNLKAELVDGKYTVTTADGKDPTEYFAGIAASDEGKHWIAAPQNSGGGAPGGKGGSSGKVIDEAAFNALPAKERAALATSAGFELVPAKAA